MLLFRSDTGENRFVLPKHGALLIRRRGLVKRNCSQRFHRHVEQVFHQAVGNGVGLGDGHGGD